MFPKIRIVFFLALAMCLTNCNKLIIPTYKVTQNSGESSGGSLPPSITLPPGTIQTSTLFTHVGGFKVPVEFASSGIGLVTNDNGEVIKIAAGDHTYQQSMSIYNIQGQSILGSTQVSNYPSIAREVTLTRAALFPYWDSRHDLRDYFITSSANGSENRICGVGRMYYNTNPQPSTNIHCTQTSNNFSTIGAAEQIPVNIPEQWVTGFGGGEDRLLGGAYDSGQGTTMGPVLGSKQPNGSWTVLYRAPNLGDFTSSLYPVLPRPLGYNCIAGNNWVCHEPISGVGVWTTERIYGGGVEMGDVAMVLPTLAFGDRDYAFQTSTFGLPALDKTYAYYFRRNAQTGKYQLQNYDAWPFSSAGQNIIGMKIGKLPGQSGIFLFVVRNNAYVYGMYNVGSVVDIFEINP